MKEREFAQKRKTDNVGKLLNLFASKPFVVSLSNHEQVNNKALSSISPFDKLRVSD